MSARRSGERLTGAKIFPQHDRAGAKVLEGNSAKRNTVNLTEDVAKSQAIKDDQGIVMAFCMERAILIGAKLHAVSIDEFTA